MQRFLFFILLFSFLSHLPAHAGSSAWQKDQDVSVRLISAVEGTGTETRIPLGLEIQLAPGWHTYWRTPGEAGQPPRFNWQTSMNPGGNLQDVQVLFPAPQRYSEQGIETIGYRDHVVLPIEAQVLSPGKALVLDTKLELLVCSATCIPKQFSFLLAIPPGEATPGPEASLIQEAQKRVPLSSGAAELTITNVQRNPDNLVITVSKKTPFSAPDIFIENDHNVVFNKPEVVMNEDKSTATFRLKTSAALPEGVSLATLPVTITITDNGQALEQKLDESFVPAGDKKHCMLWYFFLLALIGGFFLNLTPCVLPVLSLKILSVINHGGGDNCAVRRSFFTTALGILFSFLLLAGVTIGLKETGQAIGWGVQFQQPLFLVFLILLLTFFAANLWGLYEINLPRFLADKFDPQYHPKLAGDFASGAFATLLATPCTVPFLGTAVGFALAAGPTEILLIFTALGLGMAVPYFVVTLWPRLATALPRPGAWMIKLKHVLGWVLAVTATWLLWVLSIQLTLSSALEVAGGMLGIIVLLYLRRRTLFRRFVPAAIACIILFVLGIAFFSKPSEASVTSGPWQSFNELEISRYVSEGKTVFVDITASWCVNCKANKQFTFSRSEIFSRLFQSPDVVPMQADWTNPNPQLGLFMKRFGRFGIPFNAVFGPKAPQGIILPEIITPAAVFEALDKAKNES